MEMYSFGSRVNGVKGIISQRNDSSPGKVALGPQGAPDRNPATAVIRDKTTIKIGTWNVRTLYQSGKLENVKQEMTRLGVNILGVCETRWKNTGDFVSGEHRMIYSGGETHERGVGLILDKERAKCVQGYLQLSDRVLLVKLQGRPFNLSIIIVYAPTSESEEEEINKFYETVEKARSQCKSQEVIIIMGDLNAKVGCEQVGDVIGRHGLSKQNERGERFCQWCLTNGQVITNTWFENHPRRLWTWRSPRGDVKNQIDYITINKRFRNAVQHCKTYPSADCGSDHLPVICKMKIKLRKLKNTTSGPKLQYSVLAKDDNTRKEFNVNVKNRFEALGTEGEQESNWNNFKTSLVTAAKKVLPKREKQSRKQWITTEILDLMKKRQETLNRQSEEYNAIDQEIKRKINLAKEEWLNKKCEEIEQSKQKDPAEMFKKIKEISGQKLCTSPGCIKSKDGKIVMEKDKILERWSEYISELFHDERGEKPTIHKNMEGPPILRSEVEAALRKMKKNKAAGPDEIVTEMLTSLEDFGKEKLTEMMNEIYDSGVIPDDLSKSIFIALPKKPGATECELHRTISLMSHVVKLLLKIIMHRTRGKIRQEMGKEQCGFMEDTGTRNAIFMLRRLAERAIEMQRNLFVCFIDYTKAFDKVQHEELMKDLEGLDLDGKDLRLIRNLYWEQTACMKVDNKLSKYIKIERGVRQGCVFSPDLFNLYSEFIFRGIENLEGFSIGGHNLNNIRFADDSTLIAGSEQGLQRLLDETVEQSRRKGLEVNRKKTVCMVFSKKQNPSCKLHIGNDVIQQVDKFNFLGSYITEDGRCDLEIKRRIGIAKENFQRLGKILKHNKLPLETRKRVLECYVKPILMYGCECWTITPSMQKKLESVEMWFIRRMLKISWVEHQSNEEVLRKAKTERSLIKTIRERQMKFMGHIMRKEGLENLTLTGRIEGRRGRGRQRITFLGSLKDYVEKTLPSRERKKARTEEFLHLTRDRKLWRTMIAQVREGYGT